MDGQRPTSQLGVSQHLVRIGNATFGALLRTSDIAVPKKLHHGFTQGIGDDGVGVAIHVQLAIHPSIGLGLLRRSVETLGPTSGSETHLGVKCGHRVVYGRLKPCLIYPHRVHKNRFRRLLIWPT